MNASIALLLAAALALVGAGCRPKQAAGSTPAPAAPPAKVVTESDLASVVLQPEAEQRLGIATAPVVLQQVGRSRTLGGELLLPLGRLAGKTNADGRERRSIYSLLPAMTPTELVRVAELQVDADGQIATAQLQLDAARIALTRAEGLVAHQAGTQRALDEARAQVQLSEAGLETARQRRALLGAPLFEAVARDALWVRVAVYAGELDRLQRAAPARVGSLGAGTNMPPRVARPVNVPFSVSAAPAMVELFYEVDNADGALRPGQRVSVALPLAGETESPVVPAAAVLHDIHGGTWVYENTAPHTFTRRRVEVRFFAAAGAVLARGPKPGARVVTDGAAELFGAEFGAGK